MPSRSVETPDAGVSLLTKSNVRAFATAMKREAAHQRGERTPSPEQLHLGDSNDTERFLDEHPLIRNSRAERCRQGAIDYRFRKPLTVAKPNWNTSKWKAEEKVLNGDARGQPMAIADL